MGRDVRRTKPPYKRTHDRLLDCQWTPLAASAAYLSSRVIRSWPTTRRKKVYPKTNHVPIYSEIFNPISQHSDSGQSPRSSTCAPDLPSGTYTGRSQGRTRTKRNLRSSPHSLATKAQKSQEKYDSIEVSLVLYVPLWLRLSVPFVVQNHSTTRGVH